MENRLGPTLSQLEQLQQYQMFLTEMTDHVNPNLRKALTKEIVLVEIQIRQLLPTRPGVSNELGKLS